MLSGQIRCGDEESQCKSRVKEVFQNLGAPWPMCLSWSEYCPISQKSAGHMPSLWVHPRQGTQEKAPDQCFSLGLMFLSCPLSLPSPVSKSISMPSGEDLK